MERIEPDEQSVENPEAWRGKRVLVTGGAGFLGSYVVSRLAASGCERVSVPRSERYDLTRRDTVRELLEHERPDVVLHLAAVVGGIGANRDNPGRFFFDNLLMGAHLIHESMRAGVGKFVQVGTICAYPKNTPVPFREEDLWMGYPEETNAPYGIAKKALLVQLQAYRAQYGMNGIYLLPVNLYGPRDNFDPASSHVIPALIRKLLEAKRRGLAHASVWGTGEASREFLHAEDCARAILLAAERYDGAEPVNVGTGREIKIRELATLIAELVGFEGKLVYDTTKPDGQPRRCVDTNRARERFGFEACVPLREGLRQTIDWYQEEGRASEGRSSSVGP